jgi:hypothetical protein
MDYGEVDPKTASNTKGVSGDIIDVAGNKGLDFEGGGIMMRLFKKIFKIVDRPWKMYPIGVLFGLGFDANSEIAVIGISSIQGAEGTSICLILIFPALFTGTRFHPVHLNPYQVLFGRYLFLLAFQINMVAYVESFYIQSFNYYVSTADEI